MKSRHLVALALVGLILLPLVVGLATRPPGTLFLGYPYNTDDHMVYAAWMRQAAEGRFLFENRFTTDPQPGLTIHLFYLVLGWLSVPLGTLGATVLAQCALAVIFVGLTDALLGDLGLEGPLRTLGLVIACFGAGLGFLVFRNFGIALDPAGPSPLGGLLVGRLPTDVWQPEGFVFPSLFTNALFAWALCLILVILRSVVRARASARAILPGAVAFLLLANTHSYDALLLGLVLVAFFVSTLVARTLTPVWAGRGVLVALGAAPAALWLAYVLSRDPVFAARAATPTFSPGFRGVLAGYLPLILLAIPALLGERRPRDLAGVGLFALVVGGLFVAGATVPEGMFLGPAAFALVYVGAIGAAALCARGEPLRDLLVAWAFVGLVAIYLPADFQRKLAMGLSLPWALLATLGLARLLRSQPASTARLAGALAALVLCATSIRWVARGIGYVKADVASTTVQPVFFPPEVARAIEILRPLGRRAVVLAPPGIPERTEDESGARIPDRYNPPAVPDLNPVLVGMAGSRAYAGHWSETPNYPARRRELSGFFFSSNTGTPEMRAFLKAHGVTHILVPQMGGAARYSGLGETLARGKEFTLIRVE